MFRYTFFDIADVTIPGTEAMPEGKVTLKTEFTPDGSKEGGGTLKLFVNGKPAGEGTLKRSLSDTDWNRSRSAATRSPRCRPITSRRSRSPAQSRRSRLAEQINGRVAAQAGRRQASN